MGGDSGGQRGTYLNISDFVNTFYHIKCLLSTVSVEFSAHMCVFARVCVCNTDTETIGIMASKRNNALTGTRGVHLPKPMMHIASPYFSKIINFCLLSSFFFVFWFPHFDHGAFSHHV